MVSYNGLHDPHLKSYFQNPSIRKSLIEKGTDFSRLIRTCSYKIARVNPDEIVEEG